MKIKPVFTGISLQSLDSESDGRVAAFFLALYESARPIRVTVKPVVDEVKCDVVQKSDIVRLLER